MKRASLQPSREVQQCTTHDRERENGGSQEDCQPDSLCAAEEYEFALTLLREFEITSRAPSLTMLPNQHHIEGHVLTFPLVVMLQVNGYIAAREGKVALIQHGHKVVQFDGDINTKINHVL